MNFHLSLVLSHSVLQAQEIGRLKSMIEKLSDKVVALESNNNGLSSNATFKTEGTHVAAPVVGRLINNFIEPISVESYTHDKGNTGPPMKPLPVPIPSLSASIRDHMIPSTATPRALTAREGSTVTAPSAAATVPRPQSARLPSRKAGVDRDDGKDRGGSLVRASTNPNILGGGSSSNSTATFLPSSSAPAWGGGIMTGMGMGLTSGFVSHKFTWSVLNFSGLPNRMVSGPPFTVGNYTFHINLHPWGVGQAARSHLSLYLVLDGLADEGDMSDVAQVPVKYSLILNSQIDEEHSYIQGPLECTMTKASPRGWAKYISMERLRAGGLTVDDKIAITADVQIHFRKF